MQQIIKPVFWKTKDGRKMLLSQMTDAHLSNAIASIERKIAAKREELVAIFARKIECMEDEDNLEAVWRNIAMDARDDHSEQGFVNSGLAEALSPPYTARWEAYLNRIEQFKEKLELLKVGDPRGVLGYEELIKERSRRKEK